MAVQSTTLIPAARHRGRCGTPGAPSRPKRWFTSAAASRAAGEEAGGDPTPAAAVVPSGQAADHVEAQ